MPPAPQVSARTPIQFIERPKQKYIPWRVDNEAKAILDDDASALKNEPNAKLVIVGYADGEKQPMIGTGKKKHAMDLAAQRAVNAKAYLVQQQGIDPSRIEVRKGTGKDHDRGYLLGTARRGHRQRTVTARHNACRRVDGDAERERLSETEDGGS